MLIALPPTKGLEYLSNNKSNMGHISKEELSRMKVNDKETKEWIEDLLSDDYHIGFFEANEYDLTIKAGVCNIPFFKMRMICEYMNTVNKQ